MKPLKETIKGYADLKRQVESLSKRLNVLTRMEAVEVDQNGTTKFVFGDSKAILSVRTGDKEGVAEKTNDYNNTEKNSVTDSAVDENTTQTTTNEGAIQKLLDETYGGDSEAVPWDLELYSQASNTWSFSDTVPLFPDQPGSAPNTFNLKFYLVGNVFHCSGHCVGAKTNDVNVVFRDVTLDTNTTWMRLSMNDRGLTFTNSRSQTLSSGTHTVRYYDNGPGYAVDFTFTVP